MRLDSLRHSDSEFSESLILILILKLKTADDKDIFFITQFSHWSKRKIFCLLEKLLDEPPDMENVVNFQRRWCLDENEPENHTTSIIRRPIGTASGWGKQEQTSPERFVFPIYAKFSPLRKQVQISPERFVFPIHQNDNFFFHSICKQVQTSPDEPFAFPPGPSIKCQ